MQNFQERVNERLLKDEGFDHPLFGNENNEGYVYIVTDNTLSEDGRIRCKIGKSVDPYSRIHQLNMSYDATMKVSELLIEPIVFLRGYTKLEKHLHNLFNNYHISGEWYWLSNEDIEQCISIAKDFVEPKKEEENKINFTLPHLYIYTEYGYKIDLGTNQDDAFDYFINGVWFYDGEVDKFPKEPKYLFLTFEDVPVIAVDYNTDEYTLYYDEYYKNCLFHFIANYFITKFEEWHYNFIRKLTNYDSNYKPTFPKTYVNEWTIDHYLDDVHKNYNPNQLIIDFDNNTIETEKDYYDRLQTI